MEEEIHRKVAKVAKKENGRTSFLSVVSSDFQSVLWFDFLPPLPYFPILFICVHPVSFNSFQEKRKRDERDEHR